MDTTAQTARPDANVKKDMDWAISSQAATRVVDGSTTRSWSLRPRAAMAVKTHERGACASELYEEAQEDIV